MIRSMPLVTAALTASLLLGCGKTPGSKMQEAADSATGAMSDAAASATETVSEAAQSATDALGAGFADATKKATSALEGVTGGSELLKNVTDLFATAQSSLKGVTDEATAKAALPGLNELVEKAGGLSALTDKLPAEAKTAVSQMIESGLGPLKELIAKVMAIPGVEAIVKPKLDEFVAKVTALTGKQS